MKKLLVIALAVLTILLLTGAANAEVVKEGPCGDNGDNFEDDAYNAYYELTDEGVMTIHGTGAMTQKGSLSYNSAIREVIIEDGITSLGSMAFESCRNLTRVTIPGSVTDIGHSCFKNCSALTDVNIPEGITTLEMSCFKGCSSLPSITIPESVTSIVGWCFNGCEKLTSVNIPSGVNELPEGCFKDCTALSFINIPSGVTAIDESCFAGCDNLTIVCNADSYAREYAEDAFTLNNVLNLPDSTKEVKAEAFLGVGADAIYLPEGCTFVDENAFADCPNLKLIVKPDGFTIS